MVAAASATDHFLLGPQNHIAIADLGGAVHAEHAERFDAISVDGGGLSGSAILAHAPGEHLLLSGRGGPVSGGALFGARLSGSALACVARKG